MAVAAVLVVIASLAGVGMYARPNTSAMSRKGNSQGQQGALEIPAGSRSWEPGLQYGYALEYEQRLSFLSGGQGGEPGQMSRMRARLVGELTSTVVDSQEGKHVRYVLQPASFDAEEGAKLDDATRAALVTQLREPFYVSFSPAGAALQIHMAPGLSPAVRRLLRSLVASMQVVLPPDARDQWVAQELDATGNLEASYRRIEGSGTLEKSRSRYVALLTPEGLLPPGEDPKVTPSGTAQIVLDRALWIETLSGSEQVEITAASGDGMMRGEARVALRRITQGKSTELVGTFLAARGRLESEDLARPRLVEEPAEARLKRMLDGATFATLMAELRNLPDDQDARGRRTAKLVEKLTALLLLDPSAAPLVAQQVRASSEQKIYGPMLAALSAASTAESIDALARISGDEQLPRDLRVEAIVGLGVATKPDANGIGRLQKLSENADPEIRSTALLGLGTSARNLAENPLAQRVLDDLSSAVRGAASPQEKSLGLSAIANTANVEALPVIEEALGSSSSEVRAAAATALRLIPDARAEGLLEARLLRDPSADVRRSAVFASSFRPLEPLLPTLAQAMLKDPEASVRSDIVKLIGENRHRIANSQTLLQLVTQSDSSAEVRSIAQAFVDGGGRAR